MINYYQTWLAPFLKTSANKQPGSIEYLYYHSFEDGLWEIIQRKFPNQSITVLVPDFYCSDVLDNIKNNGHKYVYYRLDNNFQITTSKFTKYLWLYKPEIVIIFNAGGIRSKLLTDQTWVRELPETSLIIEDCVQQLVDPEKIKLISNRHLIIDSLRKVLPLPGSRIIGTNKGLIFLPKRDFRMSKYFFRSFWYYTIFRFGLLLGFGLNNYQLVSRSHERVLKKHDDIIGNSNLPQTGLPFLRWFIDRIDYKKIAELKKKQIKIYKTAFGKLFKTKYFFEITISASDEGSMHVYLLGVNKKWSESLMTFIKQNKIPIWYKFEDSPWSENRDVLFLPVGFDMNEQKINYLAKTLDEWTKTN